jgi:hypothetical protein
MCVPPVIHCHHILCEEKIMNRKDSVFLHNVGSRFMCGELKDRP